MSNDPLLRDRDRPVPAMIAPAPQLQHRRHQGHSFPIHALLQRNQYRATSDGMASVFELYKPFRNKIAELALDDSLGVIWAYCQYLQLDKFELPHDIEVNYQFTKLDVPQKWISEWSLEILAKEIILNSNPLPKRGKTLRSWNTLSDAVNTLRELENNIYSSRDSASTIDVELIRIAHRQFTWQMNAPNDASTIRYFKIFNQPTINDICICRIGLSVADVYLCGVAFLGTFLSHPALNVPFNLDIEALSPDKIERFLALTARPIRKLRELLKREQQYNINFAYAYNSLRAFPLVQMMFRGKNAIACPLPTLLFWRMTAGLYYELLKDPRFSQAYGRSFQDYVGEVVRRACPPGRIQVLSEQRYGSKSLARDSVDWIACDAESAMFIECKAKRLSWPAKSVLDDLGALEADIGLMARAVAQVYRTIVDYLQCQYPHLPFAPSRTIYPVIVTLENWHAFGIGILDRLHNAVRTKLREADIPSSFLDDMPYSVWSIEELEAGMQIVNSVGIQHVLAGKLRDKEMKRWEWLPYFTHQFPEHFPTRKLFRDQYDSLFSDILA